MADDPGISITHLRSTSGRPRPGNPARGHPGPGRVETFRDALGLALELADRYSLVDAAALLDPAGRTIEMAVASGLEGAGSIEPVVAWAAGAGGWSGPPQGVLIVSVRALDPDIVSEADLRRYRHAGWSLAGAGRRLLDWIETDGDLVRSYASLTCPAEAWADDPTDHRAIDGRDP